MQGDRVVWRLWSMLAGFDAGLEGGRMGGFVVECIARRAAF